MLRPRPDFARAKLHALERLERELRPDLYYHSLAHTRDDVLPAAERLARTEGVTGEPLLLLLTAAAYHDLGFLVRREEHEAASIDLAAEALPDFGYSPEHLAAIGGLIRATRLPQTPLTPLAEILADADLDVLGREDVFARNAELRAEWAVYVKPMSDIEWQENQVAFVESHHYFTASARRLREPQKQRYLQRLRTQLASLRSSHAD
jgi:uncharacterized protein